MSLASDIAAELPRLQAEAESMMLDSCVVKGAPTSGSDDDGAPIDVYPDGDVYAGPCRIRQRTATVSEETGGGETLTSTRLEVHVPVSAGDVFLPGQVVFMAGQPRYRVLEGHYQTFQTAIRLPVERVR